MEVIQHHFIDWGAFYQTCVALIFGVISTFLWWQDRKKSKLIIELQKQTKLLAEQFQHFIDIDRPCLNVISNEYSITSFLTFVENVGSDLFNLTCSNKSDSDVFKILENNIPESLASKSSFNFRHNPVNKDSQVRMDTLTFRFEDKRGKKYSQKLVLIQGKENINFQPPLKEE